MEGAAWLPWDYWNQTAPAYWPSQSYQHRDEGRYYTFPWPLGQGALKV